MDVMNIFDSRRPHALPTSLQVMIVFRFYVSGCFQAVTGEFHDVSTVSVSRVVLISSTLAELNLSCIEFPSTERDKNNTTVGYARFSDFL